MNIFMKSWIYQTIKFRNSTCRLLLFYMFFSVVFRGGVSDSIAEGGVKKNDRSNILPNDIPQNISLINIGAVSYWIYADGRSGHNPHTDGGGIHYPYFGAPVVYQDGIVWGGLVRDGSEPALRVGGMTTRASTQSGRIITKGVSYDWDKVWRIRRDIANGWIWGELEQDAELLLGFDLCSGPSNIADALRDEYIDDWRRWPWEYGAPFYDSDGDGVYTPRFRSDGVPIAYPVADEPGLANADQVVWLVCHDLDSTKTKAFTGSPPIGLEVQITLWGYDRWDAWGNTVFKRIRMIYKGTSGTPADARIDSMFLGIWVDPEIGLPENDLVGCDTVVNMAFMYNETTFDEGYVLGSSSLHTPAVGYDLLSGPDVPLGGHEVVPGQIQWSDYENIPMTTFGYYHAGEDPVEDDYNGTLEWWCLLIGRHPKTGETWQVPEALGDGTTPFAVSGDPVTGAGWIDEADGDKRMLIGCGPFSMALGDTVEMTIAVVIGQHMNPMLSFMVLKYHDRLIQNGFEHDYYIPKAPPTPHVTVTELDRTILLQWSASQEDVDEVEKWEECGYCFEGYNVYQRYMAYDERGRSEYAWRKLATYDLKNGVTTIIQEGWHDRELFGYGLVQSGSDSGIQRSMLIEEDEVNQQPLINGQEYVFAVSSYSYTPDADMVIRSMESSRAGIKVVPQKLKPGQRLHAARGDTIPVFRESGSGNGSVVVIVTDPLRLTGDDYRIVFNDDENIYWSLVNTTTDNTLLDKQTNFTGNIEYIETDGFQCKVISAFEDSCTFTPEDVLTFSTASYQPTQTDDEAREDVRQIKVFPNPYYGELNDPTGTSERYVTFSHLPEKVVIRIFNLSGNLIRTIQKNDDSQFVRWDLLNESGHFIATGMYIAHVDMPDLGVDTVLKLAVLQW